MTNIIITCTCKGTPAFAKDAFQILYPGQPVPEIVSEKNQIYTVAEKWQGTNFGNYAKALAKNQEKFAYYFEIAENGDVITQINLKTGMRVIC